MEHSWQVHFENLKKLLLRYRIQRQIVQESSRVAFHQRARDPNPTLQQMVNLVSKIG